MKIYVVVYLIADSCFTLVLRPVATGESHIPGGYVAKSYRDSIKVTKQKPKDEKRQHLAETRRRWKIRSADYWTAKSILQYIEYHSVVYSFTIEGILAELSEMLSGTAHICSLEKYRNAVEIGIERNMFTLTPDDPVDPRCWGLWIPSIKKEILKASTHPHLILATG